MLVKGRDLKTGLPKEEMVSSTELMEAFKRPARQIVDEVLAVLEMQKIYLCLVLQNPTDKESVPKCLVEHNHHELEKEIEKYMPGTIAVISLMARPPPRWLLCPAISRFSPAPR